MNERPTFEEMFYEPFHCAHNVIFIDETHFDIKLRKFGLPIGAQILVAKTAHDLVVTIEPGHHQQLFEDLRRLRQRKKLARVCAAWNDVVASPFGRCPRQHRRFHIDKTVAVEEVAHRPGDFVPQHQIRRHVVASQVEVAIFQAQFLASVFVVMKWRCF